MSEIVVRRTQGDAKHTPSDIVVPVTERKLTGRRLKEILQTVQRERGKGVWSNADPEVLVDGFVIGRVRDLDSIEQLVEIALERAR